MKDKSSTKDANDQSLVCKEGRFTLEQLLAILDYVPLCINIVDEKADSIYCNDYTVRLYGVCDKSTYLKEFYNLVPETQPDGKNSKTAFAEHVLHALEKGETKFNWLDKKLTGEELPLHITIYPLGIEDENGNKLLVSFMHDLRPQLAGDAEEMMLDGYYHNLVSYKNLFNTVAELTEEWFWVYDVGMSVIQFFGKGREILGLAAEKKPFPSYVVDSGMVYPDDLDTFLRFDQNLKNGVVEPVEVRFVQPSGNFRYYRITYKTMYNQNGKPTFSIGKTYDIDKQKRLEVLSKTDLLTNCLNKITTENTVRDILENSQGMSHALFLIDVDDFKSVNDELGHYFGDLTLMDIAKNLHTNFRGADVIGRIGGDEFLVFLQNISDETVINSKAKAIANAFKTSYSGENKDYKVSGSIGIALYPKHADSYEELYRCADKALYSSKTAGKDRYTIYSDKISDASTKNLTAVDNTNKLTNSFFDVNITSAVFDLMYQAEDVAKAINTALKLIGMHMNADRCYIAQTFNAGKSYSISYEWAAKRQFEKIEEFQDVPVQNIKDFFAEMEQNGVMYNNSPGSVALDPNGIPGFEGKRAYLLTQTKGKGHTRLVFGLDDENEHRAWSEKEINTIQYILKMISIFIASSDLRRGE